MWWVKTRPSPRQTPPTPLPRCRSWIFLWCRIFSSPPRRSTRMSSCQPPPSPKKTAPSPIPSGACSACAGQSSQSGNQNRTGGLWRRSRSAWARRASISATCARSWPKSTRSHPAMLASPTSASRIMAGCSGPARPPTTRARSICTRVALHAARANSCPSIIALRTNRRTKNIRCY